jgi:hypothetical protein
MWFPKYGASVPGEHLPGNIARIKRRQQHARHKDHDGDTDRCREEGPDRARQETKIQTMPTPANRADAVPADLTGR